MNSNSSNTAEIRVFVLVILAVWNAVADYARRHALVWPAPKLVGITHQVACYRHADNA